MRTPGNPIHLAFASRLVALPLKEPSAVTDVHVAWRSDEQAKTTLDFIQFTRDAFGNEEASNRVRAPAGRRKFGDGSEAAGRTRAASKTIIESNGEASVVYCHFAKRFVRHSCRSGFLGYVPSWNIDFESTARRNELHCERDVLQTSS
jgi:hypothetical protein